MKIIPSFLSVLADYKRIKDYTTRTPTLSNSLIDSLLNSSIYFKCENLQKSGSFKARGAFNAILSLDPSIREKGVIAFSSGNHALGISLAAKTLRIPSVIVMPSDAPLIKIEGTRKNGAEVVFYNRNTEDREVICRALAEARETTLIPPFDHADVVSGQGTAALELFEEVGDLDLLFVCCGGAGLLSGSALAAKELCPSCKVYGVEPLTGNDAQQSIRSGSIVKIPTPVTIADGAQTQAIGQIPFGIIKTVGNVHDILAVTDDNLISCLRFFAEEMKMVVEPTGCLSLAGAQFGGIDLAGKRVGVIVSGGNVDVDVYSRYLVLSKL